MSKYKEALERARKYYKETTNDVYNYKDMLEQIFPDIEESEDKKIKEEIINYFQCQSRDEPCRKHIHDKWITWLEKQGNSPIKWNKNTEGNKPQVNHSVLMKTTHSIAEGEWKGEYWEQYRWAGIVRDSDVLSWMELSDLDKQGKQKPTLRERYKNIAESEWFKKTHEGMSVSDDEKVDNVNKIEQKPAWSEEDKRMFDYALDMIEWYGGKNEKRVRLVSDWLKSLKQRIGG